MVVEDIWQTVQKREERATFSQKWNEKGSSLLLSEALASHVFFTLGINMNAHIQYAGEISPKKLHGFVNVTSSVFLALGEAVARILELWFLCYSFLSYFLFFFLLYGRQVLPVLEMDIH